jgi:hypothetical protein
LTFPLWTLQRDKCPPELAFVVVKNTLKYLAMMRCSRSLAMRGPVILVHVASVPTTEHFLRQGVHVLPSHIARDHNHVAA